MNLFFELKIEIKFTLVTISTEEINNKLNRILFSEYQ